MNAEDFLNEYKLPIEKWVEKYIPVFSKHVKTHIEEMAGELSKEDQETLHRLIMISYRDREE